jgi:hypothetical protein
MLLKFCNILQYSAIFCNILQYSAGFCNNLQESAKGCKMLSNAHNLRCYNPEKKRILELQQAEAQQIKIVSLYT